MKTFTINGKEYKAKEFDFNLICDLEDMGVAIQTAQEKPTSFIRAYATLCMNTNKAKAGAELQEHMINGGDFTEITEALSAMMEESDFFRNLTKKTEKKTAKN